MTAPTQDSPPRARRVVEVPTNDLGQAVAEIFQLQPSAGTNNINIQVIRPAELGSGRLVMGTGTTHKTWTSGSMSLRMSGPPQATVGGTLGYRLEIGNPGDLSLRDVVVVDSLPPGLTFLNSNPAAVDNQGRLEWSLGDIPARQTRTIDFNVRADRAGTFNNCANARSADNLAGQDCTSTTVFATGAAGPATVPPSTGQLEVRVTGPAQATVGQDVTFDVLVTNRGNAEITNLVLVDRFDAGLQHAASLSPIERDLPTLAPGASQPVRVVLRVTQPGQLCNTAEVVSAGGLRASGRACVTATSTGAPATGGPAPVTGQQPAISIRKTGPTVKNEGENADFSITITNTGSVRLTQIKVSDNYDRALDPVSLTDGYRFVGDDIVWLIDELPVGKSVALEINCRCVSSVARACNRTSVTTAEGARADDEACLEVRGRSGGGATSTPATGTSTATTGNLSLTIADLRDQVAVGKELTYEIKVSNNGRVADQRVELSVTAPPEMTPITNGSGGPSRFSIDGQSVRFLPFGEIQPNQTLSYQVRMRANRAGIAHVRAELRSGGSARPITAEETTTIFAPS